MVIITKNKEIKDIESLKVYGYYADNIFDDDNEEKLMKHFFPVKLKFINGSKGTGTFIFNGEEKVLEFNFFPNKITGKDTIIFETETNIMFTIDGELKFGLIENYFKLENELNESKNNIISKINYYNNLLEKYKKDIEVDDLVEGDKLYSYFSPHNTSELSL